MAGITHFVAPRFYDRIVPDLVPGSARWWTWASGAAEVAIAGALIPSRTRAKAAIAAAVLFVAIFPANVKMALDSEGGSTGEQWVAWARLPLQIPLIWWALRVASKSQRA